MLERAKGCLNSGARDSLRCASHRSKRMLHSTFWTHGAGDLDLPPWAVSMSPTTSNLPLKHDRTQERQVTSKSRRAASTFMPADGVFLDFLYPPQALAWAHTAMGPSRERWEDRNARRLPRGFIQAQASRGYASRSFAKLGDAQQDTGEHGRSEYKMPVTDSTRDGEASNWEDSKALDDLDAYEKDTGQQATESNIASAFDATSVAFASSPAELAEAAADSVQMLRNIMLGSRDGRTRAAVPGSQELSARALTLYDSLSEDDRQDRRLKIEFLTWLSTYRNHEAEKRCIELYYTIPEEDRTLPIYQAALEVLMRRGNDISAVKLHREALVTIPNALHVTKMYFEYAVERNRWQLAMNIQAQYHRAQDKQEVGRKHDMFWLAVSQIPKLLPKALSLAKYLAILRHARTSNVQALLFCANFFREALTQEFDTSDPASSKTPTSVQGGSSLPKKSIGKLFAALKPLGEATPGLYERMIMVMIRPGARYPYAQVHRIVSHVYLELRKTRYPISQAVLMMLLERLTRYWDQLSTQHEYHHSLRASMIVNDWVRLYKRLSKPVVAHLLSWHASNGRTERVKKAFAYLQEQYPSYEEQKSLLWSTIYVHARRGDLQSAKAAFDEIEKTTSQHDQLPPLVCWNALLHAYSRADDLEGAFEILQILIDQGLKPDEFSFHPVMEMLAKRGNVEGVKELLEQYDLYAQKRREAAFFGSLLTAHVNNGEVVEAETVLKQALHDVRLGKVRGSLTGSFNILLTAYATGRDVNATMRTYRWMKAEGIRMDANTFGALIQALASYRQSAAAYKILRKVMGEHGVRPTAFHYALVMAGFVNQGKYTEALEVHDHMQLRRIRPTLSSNAAFLKAKALKEHAESKAADKRKPHAEPLNESIAELYKVLQTSQGNDVNDLAVHQPQIGLRGVRRAEEVPAAYFDFLTYIHGKRRCFDVVTALFKRYKDDAIKQGATPDSETPIKLLTSLMVSHLRAGEYDDVERCWATIKEQADHFAADVPVPQLRSIEPQVDAPSLATTDLTTTQDALEAGFQPREDTSGMRNAAPEVSKQTLITERITRKASAGRKTILSRPLRFYLFALRAQSRYADALSVVSKLVRQGYALDNRTWNAFIELLCHSTPPLALLAFNLTERFLIPQFPGWARVSKSYIPNQSAKQQSLEYIRGRYLRPGQLMPQYRTMVMLGSALLQLRKIEATGGRDMFQRESIKGLEKYVGTIKQVRQQAPKTLFAVQSMPSVDDALQNEMLGQR